MKRVILSLTLIVFSVLSAIAVYNHGYWGIIEPHFTTFGFAQVFTDLVIALTLFIIWMWQDAKKVNRNPWPWLFATLATGSIAALIYLLVYKTNKNTPV